MAGQFDPAVFLDQTINEANSTSRVPIPVGEYNGMTGEVDIKQAQNKKDGSTLTFLEIPIQIDSEEVKALLGLKENPTVRYSALLDFSESGGLDTGKGKNVGLGRIREATGLNVPGQPFQFRQLAGRAIRVAIKHRVDGDDIYAEVKSVAPLK
jgi:hypothetical protein